LEEEVIACERRWLYSFPVGVVPIGKLYEKSSWMRCFVLPLMLRVMIIACGFYALILKVANFAVVDETLAAIIVVVRNSTGTHSKSVWLSNFSRVAVVCSYISSIFPVASGGSN
jgi:hypothetical protein